MPSKDFSDDISALSEGGSTFLSGRSWGGKMHRGSGSVAGAARRPLRRGRSILGGLKRWTGPDDVSVSDSLCSGVLRSDSANRVSSSTATREASAPLAGGVADFSLSGGVIASAKENNDKVRGESDVGHGRCDQKVTDNNDQLRSGPAVAQEEEDECEDARREQRKERVREKLERYKRDQRQLKQSCAELERQLSDAAEQLRKADEAAACRIRALEDEVQKTRGEKQLSAARLVETARDQGAVVKGLETKLIRQAHVIRKQKDAIGRYKARMTTMHEEMAEQEEREAERAEEYCRLRDDCEAVTEQKVQVQHLLQENIEEMMDLKMETERDAKAIRELEFNLQQQEAMLDRLAKEESEKSVQICTLEQELDARTMEVEAIDEKVEAVEAIREDANKELESKRRELETLKCHKASGGLDAAEGNRVFRDAEATVRVEDFETALQAKDDTISSLHYTITGYEATIQDLSSKAVKMSSTYKQDGYLKGKELARLRQMNAEYERKLRALQRAFENASGGSTAPGVVGGSPTHGAPVNITRQGPAFPAPGPPERQRSQESQIVVDSNFFDDASDGPASEDGRKGELPEEC